MTKRKTVEKYVLELNSCDCHPENCSCTDYMITKEGKNYAGVNLKETGDYLVKALNLYEGSNKK